jgi:hypothetical protein
MSSVRPPSCASRGGDVGSEETLAVLQVRLITASTRRPSGLLNIRIVTWLWIAWKASACRRRAGRAPPARAAAALRLAGEGVLELLGQGVDDVVGAGHLQRHRRLAEAHAGARAGSEDALHPGWP